MNKNYYLSNIPKIRLKINISKAKTVIWKFNKSSNGTSPESIIKNLDMELINMKHFKYRSTWINYKKLPIEKKEIEQRMGCASRLLVSIIARYYKFKKLKNSSDVLKYSCPYSIWISCTASKLFRIVSTVKCTQTLCQNVKLTR